MVKESSTEKLSELVDNVNGSIEKKGRDNNLIEFKFNQSLRYGEEYYTSSTSPFPKTIRFITDINK